jgi:hypothetical protein
LAFFELFGLKMEELKNSHEIQTLPNVVENKSATKLPYHKITRHEHMQETTTTGYMC